MQENPPTLPLSPAKDGGVRWLATYGVCSLDQSVNVIYPGDTIHIDYLTIPGATLDELTFAFRKEYCEKPLEKPVEVVLAAG